MIHCGSVLTYSEAEYLNRVLHNEILFGHLQKSHVCLKILITFYIFKIKVKISKITIIYYKTFTIIKNIFKK